MRWAVAAWMILSVVVAGPGRLVAAVADGLGTQHPALRTEVAEAEGGPREIEVNRPRTPFDCELPIGEKWYGSRERCLAELCAGQNVYNEYVFDAGNRRRTNPCYGQKPTDFPEK